MIVTSVMDIIRRGTSTNVAVMAGRNTISGPKIVSTFALIIKRTSTNGADIPTGGTRSAPANGFQVAFV